MNQLRVFEKSIGLNILLAATLLILATGLRSKGTWPKQFGGGITDFTSILKRAFGKFQKLLYVRGRDKKVKVQ